MITLEQLLSGQDLNAFKTSEQVLNDEKIDTVTQVIVNAWKDNGGETGKLDMDGFILDLEYAKSQLARAIRTGQILNNPNAIYSKD